MRQRWVGELEKLQSTYLAFNNKRLNEQPLHRTRVSGEARNPRYFECAVIFLYSR